MTIFGGRARAAAAAVATVAVLGAGAAVASPPRSAGFDDADGRTWLAVEREAGPRLLLVNGLSGLVEAEAALPDGVATVHFVGEGPGRTLFAAADGEVVAVDDATHRTTARPGGAGGHGLVVPGGVLVVGARLATRFPADPGGRPASSPLPLPRLADRAPVVDGRGRVWFLGSEPAGGRVAVALPASAGGAAGDEGDRVAVDRSTTGLLVVDGTVHAVADATIAPVEGSATGRAVDGPARGRIDPTVATGTRGTWAWGRGRTLTTVVAGRAPLTQELPSDITTLAVWHGRVVAVTDDAVLTGPPGDLRTIPGLGSGAALREDGGLLWATSADATVAIAPDHDRIAFDLGDTDLSLCVGDCSAAAASRFLEDKATTPAPAPAPTPAAPTTTVPPRRLEPIVVPPTLAVTSTTAARDREATSVATVPAAAPTTLVAEPAPSATTPSAVVTAPVATTTTEEERKPGRPDPPGRGGDPTTTTAPPVIVLPPVRTSLPDPDPEPVTTTTEEPTTTTAEEPLAVAIEFDLTAREGEATAQIRVQGRARDCGSTGTSTVATLAWRGSATGTRQVLVTWANNGSRTSNVASATIPSGPGRLEVSVALCGVTTSRAVTVPGDPPPTTTTTPPPTTTPPTTTTPPPTTTAPTTTPPPPTTTTRPPTTTTRPPTTTTRPPTTTTTR